MKIFRTVDDLGVIRYTNESGKYHREDGPAYEGLDFYKAWYINDKRHREDGPARIWENGDSEYWLNDLKYSKEDWEVEITKLKLKRIKDL